MKIFIASFLIMISTCASAQQLVVQAGIEKAVAGLEYGASIRVESKRLWAVGPFYQTGLTRGTVEGKLEQKNIFYGAVFQMPVATCEKLALLFNLQSGFVNEKFFVMVPSVETRVRVTERTGVTVGTGLRMGYPSFSLKVFVKLFNQ